MTRDKLISQIAYMRDYTIIPDDFYAAVKTRKKKPDKHYNAGFDKRFSGYLRYASPEAPNHADYITYVAFAIAASLSMSFMKKPSRFHLFRMLQITGYTPKDMEEYLNRENELYLDSVPSHQLQEPVFLLMHAIEDVLIDPCEWTGKKRKTANPALPRLQRLAQYMKENELLLYMDEFPEDEENRSKVDPYEAFVLRHADFSIRKRCIEMETDDALRQVEDRMEKVRALRQDAILRAVRSAPASSPKIMPGISQNAVEETKDVYLKAADIMSGETTVPPWELQTLLDRSIAIYPDNIRKMINDAAKELAEISWAYSRITEKADDETDAIDEKQENWMRCEYLPSVAAGAFRAILTGEDEIFKLRIGRNIWDNFMTESNLPIPVVPYEDLPDEYEWDTLNMDCNGKLGLKVYDERDILNIPVERRNGASDLTLPLASMLAKFSGVPVETQLYIRKSYIQFFREAGFSERKSRDFAIVLGTLENVLKMDTCCYELEEEVIYDDGRERKEDDEDDLESRKTEGNNGIAGAGKTEGDNTVSCGNGTAEDDPADRKKETQASELERRLKDARKENQACRHEISALQRENASLQREIEKLQHQLSESKHKADEEDVDENAGRNVEKNAKKNETALPDKNEINWPYHTKLRVIVFGGFEVFHREILKQLPDVRIVEVTAHIDVNPIRKADIVFLQINKTDHSGYYTVCDACKAHNVPYIHLNYASAKRCAEVMVGEIRKMEGAEA